MGALLLSLFFGRYPAPYWMPLEALRTDPLARRLIVDLRLPRVLTAALVGVTLSASGTVLQMVFRNPLVSPGFLGVSQGAAFGAAFSILFLDPSALAIQASAAAFALGGLLLSYFMASGMRFGDWTLRLILAGIAVSALFSSGVGVLKYVADPLQELPEIVFWMLGGLWGVTWREFLTILPFTLSGLTVLWLMRWRLNILSLPDETAFSLGTSPARERALLLIASVGATAAVVAVGGVVGWVGLIVPHVARRLVGADARRALPASMLAGATFTLLCDDLARTLLPGEIPLGIVTSLFGALLFVGLFTTGRERRR
jgi:iron complex transport system permease protein